MVMVHVNFPGCRFHETRTSVLVGQEGSQELRCVQRMFRSEFSPMETQERDPEISLEPPMAGSFRKQIIKFYQSQDEVFCLKFSSVLKESHVFCGSHQQQRTT